MGKKTEFQFNIGDWMSDSKLGLCSPATRGIWIDMICAMHDNGSGQVSGTMERLARSFRCSVDDIKKAIDELGETGAAEIVLRTCNDDVTVDVTVVSRRLKRGSIEREQAKNRVARHRRNGNVTVNVTEMFVDCNADVTTKEEKEGALPPFSPLDVSPQTPLLNPPYNPPTLPEKEEEKNTPNGVQKKKEMSTKALVRKFPDLDGEAWDRWVTYRRGIGKTIKPVSYEAAAKKLSKFGDDQSAVVEESIANGYQGLFALKGDVVNSEKSREFREQIKELWNRV